MIRVLVVDNHSIIRIGIKCILGKAADIAIVSEAGSGQKALEALRDDNIDIMLLDLKLPDMSGIDVLTKARQIRPDVPVIIYTMHKEPNYVIAAFKAGASGYIYKDADPEEITRALQKVASGQRHVSHSIAELLVDHIDLTAGKLPHEALTGRELEILGRLSSGVTAKEIAHQLRISVKTVSAHKTNIMRKLNLKSNAEIIKYAMTRDLIA